MTERKGEKALETRIQRAAFRKRRAVVETAARATQAGEKVIVFTGRRDDCEGLAVALRKGCPGVALWSAHGGTSQKKRAAIQAEYMEAAGPAVLCGTYQSWGQSINLHDTDLLIFAQLPYTTGQLDQAEGRAHRLGATRPVTYVYLVAEGTVDVAVRDIVLSKLVNMKAVVGAGGLGGLQDALGAMGDRGALLKAAGCA
jgi:SNF2 family DNA or RNA helicase